jgi:hypothetical protein
VAPALASEAPLPAPEPSPKVQSAWARDARFFTGLRSGVAIPPGGDGMAPGLGLELGVYSPSGPGFGLHLISVANPPSAPEIGIPRTKYAFGVAADVRLYFQTIEPLTLYPTFSLGFLAGSAVVTNRNVVMPLINPGFGARINVGGMYLALEFGAASFHIPFVNVCLGWQPERK